MQIVITGASGFVGRNLVPILSKHAELLLVGRDPEHLRRVFPNHASCSYDELPNSGRGADLLLHLATINNNQPASAEIFHKVNVELLVRTFQAADSAGIGRFVNVSSVHALDERDRSPYAESKRAGVDALSRTNGPSCVTLFLPAVYGSEFSGQLNFLNKLPSFIANPAFAVLASLKPTVHVSRLSQQILASPQEENSKIVSDEQEARPVYDFIRRLIDLAASVAMLLLFWWVFAIIWTLVRLQSPGPGIFGQERVGLNGKTFTCYKFRTMHLGTPQDATNRVSSAHITRIGAFLRKTKLDELPQAWNILRNEMSLIGPRPCLPMQVQLIEARRKRGVLKMKPGISGLAQINDIDMSDPERLAQWDAKYMALRSLLLDFKIGLATLFGRGQGDRVVT